MAGKYRFILDGTILERNPEDWEDIKITIERQKDIDGLLLLFTSELTFIKDGYALLKTRFDINYNNKITANIDILNDSGTYERLFTGVILLSDIFFNINKKTATVKLEDVSFFGAIDNNKNIKAFLDSGFTKNGTKIDVPTIFNLDFFLPSTGVYKGWGDRECYLVSDALDFLVRFMTDDVVKGIVSTYLTTPSNFEGGLLYVVLGEEIRVGAVSAPNIKFKDLFQFLKRTHNISFVIESDTNGDPVMRIEEKEFFFEQTTSFITRNIKELTLKVDKDRLYSHLELGNNTFVEAGNCSPTTRFFTFRNEDYLIEGKSNIDKVLDLKTDYVTDSNTIEEIIITSALPAADQNEDFDEDIFIITGNTAGNQAIKFLDVNLCSNQDFYNKGLTNSQIVQRYLNSIPNNIVKHLSSDTTQSMTGVDNDIELFTTIPPNINLLQVYSTDRVEFKDESTPFYDLGGNYDTGTLQNFYDVPFAGDYSFNYNLRIRLAFTGSFASVVLTAKIRRQNSSFVDFSPVDEKTKSITVHAVADGFYDSFEPPRNLLGLTPYTLDLFDSATFTCTGGNRVSLFLKVEIFNTLLISALSGNIIKDDNTFFKCLGTDTDAGTYKVFRSEDYRALVYNFEKNTNFAGFNTLTGQSLRRIKFNEGSDPTLDKLAWIDKIDYLVETSETNYQLIT